MDNKIKLFSNNERKSHLVFKNMRIYESGKIYATISLSLCAYDGKYHKRHDLEFDLEREDTDSLMENLLNILNSKYSNHINTAINRCINKYSSEKQIYNGLLESILNR
jgi:hypothetical protein